MNGKEFFQEQADFEALREQAIASLITEASPGDSLRVWVPGCATGEEAFSIGIEFLDAFALAKKRLSLHIFATDAEPEALAVARAAVYPASVVQRVSAPRLQTYFRPLADGRFQVMPALRDSVSFAVHELSEDCPFSRMHLTSCRHVLINLESGAQSRVLEVLHSALQADGYLLLGSSEPTAVDPALFSTVSKPARIYRKRETYVDIGEFKSVAANLALREQQQSVIAQLGLSALRETDLDGFMEAVTREVQRTLATDYSKILELQPGGRTLLLRAGQGWKAGVVGSACVDARADTQAGYTLRSDEPVVVDDPGQETRFASTQLLLDHEVASGLSCVICDGPEAYGVLAVHSKSGRHFSRKDASFVQAVATIVGSAVSHHQTHVALRLELSVAHALADETSRDTGLARVLDCLMAELGACAAEVWWSQHDGRTLERRLLRMHSESERAQIREELAETQLARAHGLAGHAFARGTSSWTTNVDEQHLLRHPGQFENLALVSGLAVPIRSRNQVLGVITLFSRRRLIGNELFLRSLDVIGRSIGGFVARTDSEEHIQRLAAITASSHDAIFSYQLDGTVTEWLPGAARLFGYSPEEMLGASVLRIVPEDERESFWDLTGRVCRGEVLEPTETRRLTKQGGLLPVSVRSSLFLDPGGRVVGVSATDRDITARKQAEKRLLEADRQKDEFLAMLGHELRNPLAAIRNASELLKHLAAGNPSLSQTQAILERQSAHMAKLLDGLLDVSRIVRGKIELDLEVIDLTELCQQVAAEVGERAGAQEVSLEVEWPRAPVWVEGDRVRLTQVVDNLLSNAVKFTHQGDRISFGLEQGDGRAVLRVKDTGVGIEPDMLHDVFEIFHQSQQSLDRSRGGLGIGLALVKALTEMHGGTVEARSEGRGLGSEFVVRLPTTLLRPASAQRLETKARALHLVVIEDNSDSARVLAELLQLSGYEVSIASTGSDGLALIEKSRPDAVLCDIGLPNGASGYEVARTLRSSPRTSRLPLIALSGYGRAEDVRSSKEAGFDVHLTKPVDVSELNEVLAAFFADRTFLADRSEPDN